MLPGLRDVCQDNGMYCCVCSENNCFVSLSPRADTVLFVDGEEAVASGPHCDCIIVLRRRGSNVVEIYSVELKKIRVTGPSDARGALDPDVLRQKCENCLRWALNIISNFQSVRRSSLLNINKYCVIVTPSEVYSSVVTLVKRERRRYLPSFSDGGRVLFCNSSVTGQAFVF